MIFVDLKKELYYDPKTGPSAPKKKIESCVIQKTRSNWHVGLIDEQLDELLKHADYATFSPLFETIGNGSLSKTIHKTAGQLEVSRLSSIRRSDVPFKLFSAAGVWTKQQMQYEDSFKMALTYRNSLLWLSFPASKLAI